MNAEIICVGTEILLGDILNTNAKYISEKLAELGFNVYSQSVVGDNKERLKKQLSISMARSQLIILSGGLGPTPDDITKETVAEALNLSLTEDAASLKKIQDYFARIGRVMGENNKKQALTIKGATILENKQGTAPGYCVSTKNCTVVLLPGPPSELKPMFEERVIPILKKFSNQTLVSHNIRIFGIGESQAAELCGDLLEATNPTVATYAKEGEVDIRVTASAPTHTGAEKISAPVIKKIQDVFGENIYGIDCENLQEQTVNMLKEKGMKLATAESCTAGMLSSRITEIPGSSEVFEMGVTAYANYIKIQALGVNEELIKHKGAVSPEVAAEMAVGIRTMCNADLGLGITGVAGPGQSEGKPAGLVYIALADRGKVFVRKIMCRGSNRENTRIIASSTALDMARRYLDSCSSLLSFGTPIGDPINLLEGYTLPERPTPTVIKKDSKVILSNPPIIFSDEELHDMFNSANYTDNDETPEKLEIQDEDLNFVFDDEYSIDNIYTNASDNSFFTDIDDDVDDITNIDNIDDETVSGGDNNEPKKRSFIRSLFPCGEDSSAEKIRKTVFLIALIVLIGTMGYLINYFAEGWLQNKIVDDAAKNWEADDSLKKNADGIFIGFESLMAANSDIKAWIKIDGTNINNPVYQTTDNDYYINHNMNKEASRYGALFIDKDSTISQKGNNQNVIIYGHHMRDGTMFGPLKNYVNLDFYKENSIIDFTTLYNQGEYKIFAVFITNSLPEHDNGEVFNYRYSKFTSSRQFLSWISEVKKRSIIDTGVDVISTDEILTLSTCTYEFDDARLVVMARRVRTDETQAIYDTSTAKLNSNPLYPEIWYTQKGLKKPNFNTSSNASSDISSTDNSSLTSSDITSSNGISSTTTTGGTGNAGGTSTSKPSGSASSTSSDTSSAPAPSGTTTSANSSTPAVSSAPSSEAQGGGAQSQPDTNNSNPSTP